MRARSPQLLVEPQLRGDAGQEVAEAVDGAAALAHRRR